MWDNLKGRGQALEIEQLAQLDAFERNQTLKGAALELHVSESSLSRSMKRLEADLGCTLFERTRNSMSLNAEGRIALDHARRVLADIERMRQEFDEIGRRTRTVTVASVAPAPTWFLSSRVLQQWPTMILEPDLVSVEEAEARLLRRECDLAVSIHELPASYAQSTFLMCEDLYANVPLDSDLADRDVLTFADLDGRTILVYEQIGFWRDVHRKMLPHANFVVQRDRTVFLQQVASSNFLSFTTKAPHNTSAHSSRRAIPITDDEAHATYWLGVRTDAPERIREIFELMRASIAED